MLRPNREAGDTLVEVLLSITILAIVTVSAFAVLQRGVGEAQNSLERSQVRTSIAQQMELINYFRDQFANVQATGGNTSGYPASLWNTGPGSIRQRAITNRNSGVTPSAVDDCTSAIANSFSLLRATPADPNSQYQVVPFSSANIPTTTFARPGSGLWIEPIASPSAISTQYIDFYIRACWNPSAGETKQVISSVMRVYDK